MYVCMYGINYANKTLSVCMYVCMYEYLKTRECKSLVLCMASLPACMDVCVARRSVQDFSINGNLPLPAREESIAAAGGFKRRA